MENVDVLRLDGHGLSIFVTVLETGSMTEAALKLGLNQSTVSHAVDKLRSALKDPLFVRIGRRIVPTTYALALEPRVRALLADLQGLPASAAFDPASDQNWLTIASNVTELGAGLVALRNRLHELGPGLKLRFLELGARANTAQLLVEGQVDLVISARPKFYPVELKRKLLHSDRFSVYYDAARRAPVSTIEDYCSANHATLDFGGTRPSYVDLSLREMHLSRTVTLQVPNLFSLAQFIVGTDLICTMPSRLKRTIFSHLGQSPVPFEMPDVHFDMVWHRRDDAEPRSIWLRTVTFDSLSATLDGRGPGGPVAVSSAATAGL